MSATWFYEPFYEIDRLMNEMTSPPDRRVTAGREGADIAPKPIRPRMDLHENQQANVVTAMFELSGVTKDCINLEVQNGRLTISGEAKKPEGFDDSTCAVKERRYGKFQRTIQLPQGVKENEIQANMASGILTVTFPKTAPEMAPKRIQIS